MPAFLRNLFSSLPKHGAVNYAGALAATVLTVAFQFAGLFFAVHALSIEAMGIFLGVSAASAIAATLIGLGSIDLLTAEVSRNQACAPTYVRAALTSVLWTFLVLVVPVTWLESTIFDAIPFWTVLLLNGNYLLFNRIVGLAENLQVALGRSAVAGVLRTGFAFLQMMSFACLFLVSDEQRLLALGIFVLASGAVCALATLPMLLRQLRREPTGTVRPLHESLSFMVGQTVAAAAGNLDRVLATVLLSEAGAGLYALASRAVQLALTPTTVFFRTVYHTFFSETDATRRSVPNGKLAFALIISCGSAIAACVGYAAVIQLFAPHYEASVPIFIMLSLSLPAYGLLYYFGSRLAADRRLVWRNIADIAAIAVFAFSVTALQQHQAGTFVIAVSFVSSRYFNALLYLMPPQHVRRIVDVIAHH